MRLLQLSLEPGERAALDLHPLISVVQGLDQRARDRLVRTVQAVAAGTEPPCSGTAEAHGVVLPLDEANLALLDLRAEADPVVRRTDLPGARPEAGETGSTGAAGDDPVDALLRTAPEGQHSDLDDARRHLRDTRDALAVLRDAADATARSLHDATAERRRLGELVAGVGPGQAPGASSAQDEVQAIERDLVAVDAGIAELSAFDVAPVQALVEAIEEPTTSDEVPAPEAVALADRLVRLQHDVRDLEERWELAGRSPVAAQARLDAARSATAAAEAAMSKPSVTSEDEAELRKAHETVLDAEKRASGLRSRSGQKKLAQALAHQQEILDRVGFPTWSAYVMGANLLGVDEDAKRRLEEATTELAAAESAWAEVSEAAEADPEHRTLLDRVEETEVEAVAVLLRHDQAVPDDRRDLEAALRSVRVPADADRTTELVAALAERLGALGLGVDAGHRDRVLATAHALLEETRGVPERLEQLAVERRRLEGLLHEARSRAEARAWEALEQAVERPSSDDAHEVEAALSAARAAEEELVEALEARQALVEATSLAERAASRRARAAAAALLDADSAEPTNGGLWSETDAEAIELHLMARMVSLRHVSYAGSVPLLLEDVFRGLPETVVRPVLDALDRMAEHVQLVVVSDDPAVAAWAADRGADRAAVISAAPVYA